MKTGFFRQVRLSFLRGALKPVTDAPNGLNVLSAGAKLLPQGADMHVHSPGFTQIFHAPDTVLNLSPG